MTKEKGKLERIDDYTYRIFSIFTNIALPILIIGAIAFLSLAIARIIK